MMRKTIMTGLIILPFLAFGENGEQLSARPENQSIPVEINTERKVKELFYFKKNNINSQFYSKKINTDASKIEALKGIWVLSYKIGDKSLTDKLIVNQIITADDGDIGASGEYYLGQSAVKDVLVCFYDPEVLSILNSDYVCTTDFTSSAGVTWYQSFGFKFSGDTVTGGYYGFGRTLSDVIDMQNLRKYPITGYRQASKLVENSNYDTNTQILGIEDVQVGTLHYQVTLQSTANNVFTLKSAQLLKAPLSSVPAQYNESDLILSVPKVKVLGTYYQVILKNMGNYVFQLTKADEIK